MTISQSPCHLVVCPNSRSNAFPVGGITLPSGRVISPVKVPVTLVTTVIQSPLPNWMGYGGTATLPAEAHRVTEGGHAGWRPVLAWSTDRQPASWIVMA